MTNIFVTGSRGGPKRGDIYKQHGTKSVVLSVDDTWETKEDNKGNVRRRKLNRWICTIDQDGWVSDHLSSRFFDWISREDVFFMGNSEKTAENFDNYILSLSHG